MKAESRVVGFDDGPFRFGDATVPVAGVVMRGAVRVEAVLRTAVAVDGDDATARLAEAVARAPQREGLRAVLLDGVAYGGFNLVDVDALHAAAGVPVLAVTSGASDLDAVEAALRARFADAERRLAIARRRPPRLVRTEGRPLAWTAAGLDEREVAEVLAVTTAGGLVPEPLRVAHLVAAVLAER